jgi:hypothetical protein
MFHANGDPVVSSNLSREYESAARAAGKPVTAVYYEGVRHPAALPPVAGAPDPTSKADAAARAIAFLRAALVRPTVFEGTASGAEQVPPAGGPGAGRVRLAFNDQTNDLSYTVTLNGLSPAQVTGATLNRGPRGATGPVVHHLTMNGTHTISGWVRLSAAEAADLRAGSLYIVLSSTAAPGGFARMQLATGTGAGGRIAPPSTGDAGLAEDSPATGVRP